MGASLAKFASLLLVAFAMVPQAQAADVRYGPELQGFDYPYPVSTFALTSQGESMTMDYMDIEPTGPANGRVVVMLHGKNF